MRDDDYTGPTRGWYQRQDGACVSWRGYYDECGVLVVDDDGRRRHEPLYGWDEDDDDE